MDVEFLQHRLQQIEGRKDIGFQPPNLRELVDTLVYFARRGMDLTSGVVLLDASGELLLDEGRPKVAETLRDVPEEATPLQPYFYVRDEILVPDWAVEPVEGVLNGRKRTWDRRDVGGELSVYKVRVASGDESAEGADAARRDEREGGGESGEGAGVDAFDEVAAILQNVRGRRRDAFVDPPASVNLLFAASGMDCGSPAGDPEEPGHRRPERGTPGAGEGVTVAVLDTGILPDYANYEALRDDVLFDPVDDVDHTYRRGYIHFPGCHGTFVAGVVRRVAPACTILAVKVLDELGWGSQVAVADGINRAVEAGAQVICLSLTAAIPPSSVIDPDTGLPVVAPGTVTPLALGPALANARTRGAAMVGAAGNAGRDEPTWPGTLPEVIAVGAVTVKGRQAEFSNYGPWVEAWARGTDVVSAFGTGPYRPVRGGRTRNFKGLASWSGTSFATPLLAGLVAAFMASDGSTALHALRAVLRDCVRAPQLGPGPTGYGVPLVTLDTRVSYPPSPPAPPPGP